MTEPVDADAFWTAAAGMPWWQVMEQLIALCDPRGVAGYNENYRRLMVHHPAGQAFITRNATRILVANQHPDGLAAGVRKAKEEAMRD